MTGKSMWCYSMLVVKARARTARRATTAPGEVVGGSLGAGKAAGGFPFPSHTVSRVGTPYSPVGSGCISTAISTCARPTILAAPVVD